MVSCNRELRTETGSRFFNPYEVTRDYTEANAWQYSFYVPHDIKGLINLHGADANLEKLLDQMFTDETRPDSGIMTFPVIQGSTRMETNPVTIWLICIITPVRPGNHKSLSDRL